tara:strand:- start:175 stop:612 length:438 start_codon:yes stop_codon:yes gene_type:complete
MYNALSSKVAFDNLEDSLSGALNVYPTLAAAVQVTCHSDAYTYGSYTEVVPASTITGDFFLESIQIEEVSGTDAFQVSVGTGTAASETEVAVARAYFPHTSYTGPRVIPIRKRIDANTRIAVRAANSSAASALIVHVSITYRLVS